MKILSEQQVDSYRRDGYVQADGVMSEQALILAERILRDWSERQIGEWLQEGSIDDVRPDLEFRCRLAQLWQEAGRPKYLRSPRRDLVGPDMYALLVEPSLLDLPKTCWGLQSSRCMGFSMRGPNSQTNAGPIRPGIKTRSTTATPSRFTC